MVTLGDHQGAHRFASPMAVLEGRKKKRHGELALQ